MDVGVPEPPGMRADLRDQGFDRLQHGVGSPREVVRMAFEAGAQARGASLLARREEADVLGLRLASLAGRQAVDPGRQDPGEEPSVPRGVSRGEAGIHVGVGHSHGRGTG